MKLEDKEILVRSIPASLTTREAHEDEGPIIEGYFSVFGDTYDMGPGLSESVDRHAFDETLADDVRALIDHDTRLVLGRTSAHTLDLKVDEHGLWGRIEVNPNDSDAMNLYARVQRGDVDQCSFGFNILDESTEIREDGSIHWTIKKVKLYEVSCCTFPAYEETNISARERQRDEMIERKLQAEREKLYKEFINRLLPRIQLYCIKNIRNS